MISFGRGKEESVMEAGRTDEAIIVEARVVVEVVLENICRDSLRGMTKGRRLVRRRISNGK